MDRRDILIVGAGVIGLTTALELVHRRPDLADRLRIISKHLPGDFSSSEYCSPVAGAMFSSIVLRYSDLVELSKQTYPILLDLARGPEARDAGIAVMPAHEYWDEQPQDPSAITDWGKDIEGFKVLVDDERPANTEYGITYTTVCINSPRYLSWLENKLKQTHKIPIERGIVSDLRGSGAAMVFNCTGLSAGKLVPDKNVYPVRGQIVIAADEKELIRATYSRHSSDDVVSYIIPRPYSGTVVLGGTYIVGNYSTDIWREVTTGILDRTSKLHSAVSVMKILQEMVGLRPARTDGLKIEVEKLSGDDMLVHVYGVGGAGYLTSWGTAKRAVDHFLACKESFVRE